MLRPYSQEFDIICGLARSTSSSSNKSSRNTKSPLEQRSNSATRSATRCVTRSARNATTPNTGNQRLQDATIQHYTEYAAASNKAGQMRAARKVMIDLLSSKSRFLTKDPHHDRFRLASIRTIRDTIWHSLSTMKAQKVRRARRLQRSNSSSSVCDGAPNKKNRVSSPRQYQHQQHVVEQSNSSLLRDDDEVVPDRTYSAIPCNSGIAPPSMASNMVNQQQEELLVHSGANLVSTTAGCFNHVSNYYQVFPAPPAPNFEHVTTSVRHIPFYSQYPQLSFNHPFAGL